MDFKVIFLCLVFNVSIETQAVVLKSEENQQTVILMTDLTTKLGKVDLLLSEKDNRMNELETKFSKMELLLSAKDHRMDDCEKQFTEMKLLLNKKDRRMNKFERNFIKMAGLVSKKDHSLNLLKTELVNLKIAFENYKSEKEFKLLVIDPILPETDLNLNNIDEYVQPFDSEIVSNSTIVKRLQQSSINETVIQIQLESTKNRKIVQQLQLESTKNSKDVHQLQLESIKNRKIVQQLQLESTKNSKTVQQLQLGSTKNSKTVQQHKKDSTKNSKPAVQQLQLESTKNNKIIQQLQLDLTKHTKIIQQRSGFPGRSLRKRVTPEPSIIAFHATLSQQTLTPLTSNTIKYDEELLDMGNGYNPHEGIYIVPESGVYVLTWTTLTNGIYVQTLLIVNGDTKGRSWSDTRQGGEEHSSTAVVVTKLNAGDRVLIQIGGNHGGSGFIHSNQVLYQPSFSGWKLS